MKFDLIICGSERGIRLLQVRFVTGDEFPSCFKALLWIDGQCFGEVSLYTRTFTDGHWFLLPEGAEITAASHLSIEVSESRLAYYHVIATLLSRNGYEREAGLLALDNTVLNSEDILVALLLRLNDWVPQVRQAAIDKTPSWVRACDKGFILKHLHKIDQLKNKERADHTEFIRFCHQLFANEKALLLHMLVGSDTKAALSSFELLMEYQLIDVSELLGWVDRIKDVVTLSRLAVFVETISCEQFLQLEPVLAKPAYKDFKSAYLRCYVRCHHESATFVKAHLFSKTKGVCETAYFLAKAQQLDPIAIYKRILLDTRAAANLLKSTLMMREFLAKESWYYEQVACLVLTHDTLSIRRKALRQLIKYDPTRAKKIVFKAMQSTDIELIELVGAHLSKLMIGIDEVRALLCFEAAPCLAAQQLWVTLVDAKMHEWQQLLTWLNVYDRCDKALYEQLQIPQKIAQCYVGFRSEADESRLVVWLKQHDNLFLNEVIHCLKATYHGKAFLRTQGFAL